MLSQIALHGVDHTGNFRHILDMKCMFFPGGEPHVKFTVVPDYDTVIVTAKISDFQGMGMIAMVKDYLDRKCTHAKTVLYIPYLPGARQDRGEPLGCKVYADYINLMNFDVVVCVDPHSDVMPALIDNLIRIELEDVFNINFVHTSTPNEPVLIAPDAGAIKKVEKLAQKHSLPIAYGRKHRDISTGVLSGFSCDELPSDVDVIIVDDICDGGGTFLGLADVIGHDPENTHLWTTHGIYSKGLKELQKRFASIVCTDSYPVSHNGTYTDKFDRKADNHRQSIFNTVINYLIERNIL